MRQRLSLLKFCVVAVLIFDAVSSLRFLRESNNYIIEIAYNINRPFCYSFDEGNSGDDNPTTVIHRAVDNLFTAIKIVAEPVARVH